MWNVSLWAKMLNGKQLGKQNKQINWHNYCHSYCLPTIDILYYGRINGNQLKELPPKVFDGLTRLQYLYLYWLLKIRNRTNPKLSLIALLNLCKRFSQDFVRHCWYVTRFDNDFSLKFASFTLPFWRVLILAIDNVIYQFKD